MNIYKSFHKCEGVNGDFENLVQGSGVSAVLNLAIDMMFSSNDANTVSTIYNVLCVTYKCPHQFHPGKVEAGEYVVIIPFFDNKDRRFCMYFLQIQ